MKGTYGFETVTLKGPGGLTLELDRSELVPENPGEGTPAMVYLEPSGASGTYWCALDTGEVDGVEITAQQQRWLESKEEVVSEFLWPQELELDPEEETL